MKNCVIITPSGVKVYTYWQDNIIINSDSPAICWKASQKKDIYSKGNVRGFSKLGSVNSEDALSWNLFRSLEKWGALDNFASRLGLRDRYRVLYWFRPYDSSVALADFQECLDRIEPWGRGGRRQQTESDIILLGQKNVVMVENKLGWPRKKIDAWGKRGGQVPKEYLDFVTPLFKDQLEWGEMGRFYQLYRQLILGVEFGKRVCLKPHLLAIYNDLNHSQSGRGYDEEFQEFSSTLRDPTVVQCVSWKRLISEVDSLNELTLANLMFKLREHPCLQNS